MKEKFNELINQTVKPLLKAHHFRKKGMDFYKDTDDLIFLVNFQHSHGNSTEQLRFYINCGIHSTKIDSVIGKPALQQPKEYDCYFRARISSITKSDLDSYFITPETNLPNLSSALQADLKTVISTFDDIHSTNDLTNLMIKKNGLNNYRELFEYLVLTANQPDLMRFSKHLFHNFGSENRWSIFERNLMEVLKENNRKETFKDLLREE